MGTPPQKQHRFKSHTFSLLNMSIKLRKFIINRRNRPTPDGTLFFEKEKDYEEIR
jgi:hypothetical protein